MTLIKRKFASLEFTTFSNSTPLKKETSQPHDKHSIRPSHHPSDFGKTISTMPR